MIFSKSAISARRSRVEKAFEGILTRDDLILIFCGEPIQKPGGLDQTYFFLPHPEYYWLTGSRRALGAIAYSPGGGWVDFVQPITLQEKLWEGDTEVLSGKDVAQLEEWVGNRKFHRIFVLGQPNLAQKKWATGVMELAQVQEALNQERRLKDQEELDLIARAADAAAQGYALMKSFLRPGISEREVQIAFEAEVLRAGSEKFPYDTIVGSGVNAATLHAIPTTKILKDGELVLMDAGADIEDYCVDITRVFAVNGQFTSKQKEIYDLVLASQLAAIEASQPGVEWHQVHLTAAQVIAEGLKSLNILKGSVEDILETGAVSVFFPHGVGHMVGHRVRDVGPVFGKTVRNCAGVRVRVDFSLSENMVMTAEPGIYFVPELIRHSKSEKKFDEFVNWSEAEKWLDFGGIRIEDDILITPNGAKNLTAQVPK